jgi:hypothetical protein
MWHINSPSGHATLMASFPMNYNTNNNNSNSGGAWGNLSIVSKLLEVFKYVTDWKMSCSPQES